MKKLLLPIILFFAFISSVQSQYLMEEIDKAEKPEVQGNRWVFGGDFGLMFGSYTYINISPTVGYRFTERLTAGTGITYLYLKEEITYSYGGVVSSYDHKTNVYGGKLYANYALFTNLHEKINFSVGDVVVYGEYEPLNVDRYTAFNGFMEKDGRVWAHGVLVGGGITLPIGKRSAVKVLYLYNLNETSNTPYENPILRINFIF